MLALLSFALVTRIFTGINYIEDIDSLRFALSLIKFDVINLQPHFPVYPIFTWLAISIHSIFKSNLLTFSIIGGFSSFITICYIIKQFDFKIRSTEGLFIAFTLFFNPLLWIMSVRYMPDLMGISFITIIIYTLTSSRGHGHIGFLCSGLLLGVRLSYLPLIIPLLISKYFYSDNRKRVTLFFALGVFVWLIPLIMLTGFEDLVEAARRQTDGHFNAFGGTLSTEPNLFERVIRIFRSIWADGMGLYWPGRHWLTLLTTVFLLSIYLFPLGISENKTKTLPNLNISILVGVIIYLIWIFSFQNVIHKSRHILPVLPFICIIIGTVMTKQWKAGKVVNRILVSGFMFCYSAVTLHLVFQHQSPTAISQIKDHLTSSKGSNVEIVTAPLIKFYLQNHDVKAKFIVTQNQNDLDTLYSDYRNREIKTNTTFVSIGSQVNFVVPKSNMTFYHNPYVNRLWPVLSLYEY